MMSIEDLNIQANLGFLYYRGLASAQDFYANTLGLEMREPLSDAESIPVRAFVTYDIAGYFLEFDWFYEDPRNTKILNYLG